MEMEKPTPHGSENIGAYRDSAGKLYFNGRLLTEGEIRFLRRFALFLWPPDDDIELPSESNES